jgi:hypothetical protein
MAKSQGGEAVSDDEINGAISDAIGISYFPNFCDDLNLMYEAERTLQSDQEAAFRGWLWLAYGQPDRRCKIVHATARERAEAFLKAVGKWNEAKP